MTRVLDLTLIGGPSIQHWMDDERPYTAVRVPPGVQLTMAQFETWQRLASKGAKAQERYAAEVARAAA